MLCRSPQGDCLTPSHHSLGASDEKTPQAPDILGCPTRLLHLAKESSTLKQDRDILYLPNPQSERLLHARLQAGEDAAFRECYEQLAPRLMRVLQRIVRDVPLAEELLQETFIAAFRNIHQFRGETTLGGWLTRIATNRAYNALRNQARWRELAAIPEDEPALPSEPRFEDRQLARKVLAILDEMAPAKKLALLLQAEGYSVAEIAGIAQEPLGTILARLSRARAELSTRMAVAGLVRNEQPAPQARRRLESCADS
jgi:RNA polymerase sigma-70 factor (ECF subfamily)